MARNGEEEDEGGEQNQNEHQQELRRSSSAESESESPPLVTSSSAVLRPKRDPFLIVCRCFSVITALSAILCIVVNILSAIRSFKKIKGGSDVFDGIFRCYAVVLALFVVIAETEWSLVFKLCKVPVSWRTFTFCIPLVFDAGLAIPGSFSLPYTETLGNFISPVLNMLTIKFGGGYN